MVIDLMQSIFGIDVCKFLIGKCDFTLIKILRERSLKGIEPGITVLVTSVEPWICISLAKRRGIPTMYLPWHCLEWKKQNSPLTEVASSTQRASATKIWARE